MEELIPSPSPDEVQHRRRIGILIALGVLAIVLPLLAILLVQTTVAPILREQAAEADTRARADVTALGQDIAHYFIDHYGPPPQITVVDGEYHLSGAAPPYDVEVVGEGVDFGGVTGSNAIDWCVWVTHPDGKDKDYRYSASDGLEEGRC